MAYRGSGLVPFFGTGSSIFGLRREIDRLFEDAVGSGSRWTPAVDVREDDQSIDLEFELPGMKPEDVTINVENGILSVSGEKRSERKEGEEGRYHMVERTYGSFFRSFQLPQGVDENQIHAEFDNGVLSVRIPKAALPQPRRIEIGRGKGEREVKATTAREPASGRSGAKSGSEGSASEQRRVAGTPEGQSGRQGEPTNR
ncbi:MAG TPA: Hsp20/alpha crystallin family protein [Gemmatimonadaceae bacterium]